MDVLVTGATGTVGSALLPVLLADPATRLHLLVRGRDPAHAEARVDETLAELAAAGLGPAAGDRARIRVYCGDAARPGLGLAADDHARLASQLTHVVHAAASVKMNQDLAGARASCVQPVEQILALADSCAARGQPLARLVFVSTVGVVGNVTGTALERPFDMPRTFRNTYEEAKAEAEAIVLARIEHGLPASLLRPTMVVGDSRTGWAKRAQVFHTLCELVSGRFTNGAVPAPIALELDVIPADYVARAIAILLRADDATGIFHAAAGPELNLGLLDDLLPMVRAAYLQRGHQLVPTRVVDQAEYHAIVSALAGSSDRSRAGFGKAMSFILPYLDKSHYFDNRNARALFGRHGLAVPRPPDFLPRVIDRGCPAP